MTLPDDDRRRVPARAQGAVDAPEGKTSSRFWERALALAFVNSLVHLLIGLVALLVGAGLCIAGGAARTSMIAKVFGLEVALNDAIPGVVLIVVGLFVIMIGRFRVRSK